MILNELLIVLPEAQNVEIRASTLRQINIADYVDKAKDGTDLLRLLEDESIKYIQTTVYDGPASEYKDVNVLNQTVRKLQTSEDRIIIILESDSKTNLTLSEVFQVIPQYAKVKIWDTYLKQSFDPTYVDYICYDGTRADADDEKNALHYQYDSRKFRTVASIRPDIEEVCICLYTPEHDTGKRLFVEL